jgi:hypothetical protein
VTISAHEWLNGSFPFCGEATRSARERADLHDPGSVIHDQRRSAVKNGLRSERVALRSATGTCHPAVVPSNISFMGQRRSQKIDLRDILPPLVGLSLIGVLFIPGIKQWLDALFVWALGLLSLAVIALFIRTMWRRPPAKEQEEAPTLLPIYIHSAEERARFRAMCGVTERPRTPMKVVTPQVDDHAPASDSTGQP